MGEQTVLLLEYVSTSLWKLPSTFRTWWSSLSTKPCSWKTKRRVHPSNHRCIWWGLSNTNTPWWKPAGCSGLHPTSTTLWFHGPSHCRREKCWGVVCCRRYVSGVVLIFVSSVVPIAILLSIDIVSACCVLYGTRGGCIPPVSVVLVFRVLESLRRAWRNGIAWSDVVLPNLNSLIIERGLGR